MNRTTFVFLLVASIQLTLFLFVSLRPNWIAPPGHTYTILGENFFYPNIIRQSKDGAWSIIDAHTTRPTPRVYAYIFFIGAGKVARFMQIDPVVMYQILRITGGIAVLGATYWLISLLLPSSLRTLALLFTLVLETGPRLSDIMTKPLGLWSAASEGQAVIARHFGLPHHTWGEAMGLMLISILFLAVKKPNIIYIPIIMVLGIIGTNTLPSYFVILASCVFLPWIIYSLVTHNLKRTAPPIILATLAIIAGGLFVQHEFAKGPPWNAAVMIEKSWWTTEYVLLPFIQSLTLFYPFAAIALLLSPIVWRRWSKELRQTFILAVSWATLPIALIFFSTVSWFPIANGRIASDVSPIPMGILGTLGVGMLVRRRKLFIIISLCMLFGLASILTYIYTQRILEKQQQFSSNIYPTTDTWSAVMALKTVPQGSGILVLPSFGEIIPGFANVRVFIGGPHGFLDWIERKSQAQEFYSGTLSAGAASNFLKSNDIQYVFFGPDEQSFTTQSPLYPTILQPIFTNQTVSVFRVI